MSARNRPRITKAVSLGLGSLLPSKDQQRRIKQLVIFMAIASHLNLPLTDKRPLILYAQEPTFTSTDEAFLQSLGIHILKTPSTLELGEAGRVIDGETLVYSPFLTVNTYKLLLGPSSQVTIPSLDPWDHIPMLVGDDFNALRLKWEKRTAEHRDVEGLLKAIKFGNYRRRAVNSEGFWQDTDRTFPMALYWIQSFSRDSGSALSPVTGRKKQQTR
ncbi:hypothetical protein FZEAL_3733 [Fusarium zealandicum]|uniref:SRR1-like domain-containing protein n=1 Tax=Fusarium zealandicum TaxID=1053134 RepID=A0A8H4UN79_9HYPO|nr:hypothetical protein FZEAL_3733 [Fusarium zealandicum]